MKAVAVGGNRLVWWAALVFVLALGGGCVPESPLGMVVVGPGEAVEIRSLEVLTGIGVRGIPRQRAVALAVDDYGPIKGHRVTMGAGSGYAVYGGRGQGGGGDGGWRPARGGCGWDFVLGGGG